MIINETDNRNRCVLVVADLGLDWRNDLLGLETVVAADSGTACRDVMNRKEKRDAKNARHRRNEDRRFNRKIEKIWNPWRDMMAESARYADLNMTETAAVK